jgi:hypothetical protein
MSSYDYPVFGMVHGRGGRAGIGPATSGLTMSERTADNSVEREKYTDTGVASGNLEWDYTRKVAGNHVSISKVEATSSLGEAETISERKVFFNESDRNQTSSFSDWQIFNASGTAVGAGTGTTDTDTSPAATFDGADGESV